MVGADRHVLSSKYLRDQHPAPQAAGKESETLILGWAFETSATKNTPFQTAHQLGIANPRTCGGHAYSNHDTGCWSRVAFGVFKRSLGWGEVHGRGDAEQGIPKSSCLVKLAHLFVFWV